METYHPVLASSTFADVILPLAVPKPYTYSVPEELVPQVKTGVRVEVQFGANKHYAGLVMKVHRQAPPHKIKEIQAVIDEVPLLNERTFQCWQWLSDYYACTLGEVMEAAVPANLKLASERRLVLSPIYQDNLDGLTDKEYLIGEALSLQESVTIEDVRKILNQKTVMPLIKRLLEKKAVMAAYEYSDN
ncbi:MAG: primosomal protein N', partial [Bacteroidota bacterium]